MKRLIGYDHLHAGDNPQALQIMKVSAQAYPDSPIPYEGLAEAYLALGEKRMARDNARNGIKNACQQILKQLNAPL